MKTARQRRRERLEETEVVTAPEQYGARASAAKICAYCKHEYIRPCTEQTKPSCQNYQFILSQAKGKKK